MSFVRILSFLPQAFARIDKSHELAQSRARASLAHTLSALLPSYEGMYEIEYHATTLTFYSSSPALKSLIHRSQNEIKKRLEEASPDIPVSKFVFKGPRR